MGKVKKPATVARKELEETIVNAINGSGLPAFAVIPIVKDMLAQLQSMEAKQYEADKAEYEKRLKEAAEEEEESTADCEEGGS